MKPCIPSFPSQTLPLVFSSNDMADFAELMLLLEASFYQVATTFALWGELWNTPIAGSEADAA